MTSASRPLHWTHIRKLTVGTNDVKIRLYTWGGVREASFPKDEFINVYLGYVMADPN